MRRRSCSRALAQLSLVVTVSIILPRVAWAQSSAPLAPLQFLLGEWEGIGDQAGATGGFTFAPSVQNRVIIRTNFSNTPAAGGNPASRHDDLMIIYAESGGVKAEYFDNEGHVIRYAVNARPDEIVFLSEVKPSEPRFRLTYTLASNGLRGQFEVAPPGKPDAFAPYLSWTARKIRR